MTKHRIPPQHPVATVWQNVAGAPAKQEPQPQQIAPERKLERKEPVRKPVLRAKSKAPSDISLNGMTICDDPWSAKQSISKRSIHEALFDKLKPGQAIKCQPKRAGGIGKMMRNYLRRTGKDKTHRASYTENYGDGMGRVWLLLRDDKRTKGAA